MLNDELEHKFSFNHSESKNSLDVLLELIKKKKTDIRDIDIKDLTDQFIKYFHEHENTVSLEEYSDYANMSAYLIELKTRSLLPNADLSMKDRKSIEDEQEAFIKRLLEYQMYKNAVPLLNKYKEKRSFLIDKYPEDFDEYLTSDAPIVKLPKHMHPDKLRDALEQVLLKQVIKERLETPVDLHMSVQEYSVEEVVLDLINTLHKSNTHSTLFSDFFLSLSVAKQNIDYFCMLVFVMLSLVHQGYLFIDEKMDYDFFIELNQELLSSQDVAANFIKQIKTELFGEE